MDRKTKLGYCGCTDELSIAKIMLHHYEEPIISGTNGSGAIFFGGCNLKCVYCQNGAISTAQTGEVYTREKLISAILDLEEKGAHNINLVTATHYIDQVAQILEVVKPRLSIPVIYNCGGYESVNSLKKLDGLVEVYLPDFKYADNDLAMKYSFARNYRETVISAIEEMLRQQPTVKIENGLIQRGVIIRHLVLPSHRQDSFSVLDIIAEKFKSAKVSIMRQYTPAFNRSNYKNLNRKLTSFEYDSVVNHAVELGLDGFTQEKGCENEKFTPNFMKNLR